LDIATNFASGKEVVGAIFHDTKGKEKRQEDADKGGSGHNSKKKKTKQSCKDPLVAVAERKNPRALPEGGPGVFDESSRSRARTIEAWSNTPSRNVA
jgi:hypothetical protein